MNLQKRVFSLSLLVSLVTILCISCSDSTGTKERKWELIWQDEFDEVAGQVPDSLKWEAQVGDGTLYDLPPGWGNGQLEYDTGRSENVSMDGQGNLAIVARKEVYMGKSYTSARLVTQDIFEQAYGRFEARIKLPYGQGIWPAFWLLGDNFEEDGWPTCGEIDIMEYRGQETSTIHGTVHGPGYYAANGVTQRYDLPNARFDTDFHIFAVEWGTDFIDFFVDDQLYNTITPSDVSGEWVFDHPFFIILNVAVGGGYVGSPNESTSFPQSMLVDYVRVYQEK